MDWQIPKLFAARKFSGSVHAGLALGIGSQPCMGIERNACQVRRKHASAPQQLARGRLDFAKPRNSISTMKR